MALGDNVYIVNGNQCSTKECHTMPVGTQPHLEQPGHLLKVNNEEQIKEDYLLAVGKRDELITIGDEVKRV